MELLTSQTVSKDSFAVIESPVSLDDKQQSFQIELKIFIRKEYHV